MSNYNKSFNFRNGVQVDDSNFIVNATGLVGIGTTVPQKRLDVRGNAQISGGTDLSNLNVTGIVTVGAGITLDSTSGIITATKFVGDASGLTNIVAISTVGLIANAGSLSTTAKLGIGSLTPTKQLDVVGNSKFEGDADIVGVVTARTGIKVLAGGIDGVGVVTSTSLVIDDYIYHSGDTNTFFGFESSDRIRFNTNGSDKFAINASGHLILLDDDDTYFYHPEDNTFAFVTTGDERLTISGAGLTVTGEISATGAVRATSFSGHSGVPAEFANGLIAAASTFNSDVTFTGAGATILFDSSENALEFKDDAVARFGDGNDLNIFHNGSDSYIAHTGIGSLVVRANSFNVRNLLNNEDYITAEQNGSVNLYHNDSLRLSTLGIGVSILGQLNVAQPDGGPGGLSTYSGALRYGNTESASPYSTETSLDLINYDIGNLNFYLDAENRSASPGNFYWKRGFSGGSGNLMTLTGTTGRLGVGVTEPEQTLHVGGGTTVEGSLYVSNDVFIIGSLTVPTINSDVFGNLTGDVDGNITGNVNVNTGISTFRRIEIPGTTGKLGIGAAAPTENSTDVVRINSYAGSGPRNRVTINSLGQIGIKTEIIISNDQVGVDCRDYAGLFKNLVVGRDPELSANQPAIDFRDAGTITGVTTNRAMVLPTVNNSSRNLLPTIAGSLIYNSTSNRMELYNGTAWVGVATVTES